MNLGYYRTPVSQTDTPEANSDERIRKIYVKDLRVGEIIHTVFRAPQKEKHLSRGGKPYLALTLVDKTGQVDGRVFDNVEAAAQAFSAEDYLLVKAKVGQFHGKLQLVIERLERLDAGPIDAKEFAWNAPAPAEKPTRENQDGTAPKIHLSRRLSKLLESPQVAQALDALLAQIEKALDERGGPKANHTSPPSLPRKARGPRVERKAKLEGDGPKDAGETAAKPARDPSLPEGLAFKPFTSLIGETEKPAHDAPSLGE